MENSFHFDLSLSRDLELLRVSRLTDANTGRKSYTDTWQAQTAGDVCLQGSDTRRRTQPRTGWELQHESLVSAMGAERNTQGWLETL